MNNLETVDGSIIVNNNIPSFKGLEKISKIGNDLELTNVSSFKGLEGLLEIGGNLKIHRGTFYSFSGLDNLKIVQGDFMLYSEASAA